MQFSAAVLCPPPLSPQRVAQPILMKFYIYRSIREYIVGALLCQRKHNANKADDAIGQSMKSLLEHSEKDSTCMYYIIHFKKRLCAENINLCMDAFSFRPLTPHLEPI